MKKSTLILSALVVVFVATTAYFGFQNSDLRAEQAATKQQLDQQREENRKIFDLESKNKIARENLAKAEEKNRTQAKEFEEANARALALQKANDDANAKISEQKKTIDEQNSALDSSKSAEEKNRATIEELQKTLAEENKRTEELNGEIVRLRSNQDRKELEASLAEKDQTINALSDERSALVEKLSECEMKLADLQQRYDALRSTQKDGAAAADSRVDELKTELEAQKKKVAELENINRKLRRQNANRY